MAGCNAGEAAQMVEPVSGRAEGSFEVHLAPQEQSEGAPNGRMAIRKTFEGDLTGTSSGEMLTSSDAANGSGAYVAIERVTGRLSGRSGSFYLVHRGIMERGRRELSITVVPESGTAELAGIRGTMTLDLSEGLHRYSFDYQLPR